MKLLLVTVTAIAVFTADGRDFRNEPGESQQIEELQPESNGNGRKDSCKAKSTCILSGGVCMAKKTLCMGKVVPQGCKGANCQCCIPGCPLDQGFFKTPHPYNQCFKLFDKPSNWKDANHTCHHAGLVLAKPLETIALKNYLVMRYGDLSKSKIKGGHRITAWLDAVADGNCMKWNRGPYECIDRNIPIWWPGQPVVSVGRCLLLTSNPSDWKSYPEQSLYALPCSTADRYPLCELLM